MDKKLTITLAIAAFAASMQAQTADELLAQGREAYMNYEFSKAANLYAQAKKKAKRADEYFTDKYDSYRHQLTEAENFLERVERISVIDSLTVPRKDFFRAYRLPASAGSLRGAEAMPGLREPGQQTDYVFTNEGGDYKLWSAPDSVGNMRPVESILMTDGNWSAPTPLWDDLSEDSDAIYPFMMADGVTLYYADNGENSIGGYDIMVATRDAADGTFLQPSNLGFPYNSPYDDYMLAIDELNGVGWWATDRNRLDDELTVYVFIVNDLRKNYDADEEGLTGFARIDDYLATQPEDADYDALLATIRSIDPEAASRVPEFTLPTPGGRIYHFYEDLPDMASRGAAKKYIRSLGDLEESEQALADMRREYANTRSASLGKSIEAAENNLATMRLRTAQLRSELYKALSK